MPGIAGIISLKPAAETGRLVKAMLGIMRHESFYLTGDFSAPEIGVSAGWVAQENSFSSQQVFQNAAKDIALIFSGECFADAETKARLSQNGHTVSETNGDWLVPFYEAAGETFFEKLNGVFSGLLIDRRRRKIFLFNDRFGMDRIYWHETTDTFYFASEAKALLRVLPELREFDREGVAEYLAVGSTLGERTIFRGIQRLPGGACWTIADGRSVRKNYFSPSVWESQPALTVEEFDEKFSETFKKVLPRYFASESNIGIALTGGLDTRMIMACLPQTGRGQICYTFAGQANETTLDDKIAAQVAAACGLQHQLLRLGPDFFSEFDAHADRTVFITDGSSGILGAHEIYFNRQARALSTVRLTGNFGGEILRGVSTFGPLRLAPELFRPEVGNAINSAVTALAVLKGNPCTFAVCKEIPWNIFGTVAAARSQVAVRTPYLDNELVALGYQTPPENKKSSLTPMRFILANNSKLGAIPTDRGFSAKNSGPAFLARRIFAEVTFKLDYYNNEGLPDKVSIFNPAFKWFAAKSKLAGTHKYLHYSDWFRHSLVGFINEKISAVPDSPFWRREFVAEMAAKHLAGRKNFSPEINAVLTLEAVERLLFRELPRGLEN